ncbi:protein of unknown function [Salinihabitans flavidus]|uniref:DUF4174 domain-containing protein n=1 Tax=Salinihabitans flavidus TaxID=569882 RepID=A0A1H8UEQ1_9RHOB|nr:DUF4174 domain-containing protein [Salinihabitans flavidus]SEP01344.1 protein of unknown function [Salinihabitans flavidus]
MIHRLIFVVLAFLGSATLAQDAAPVEKAAPIEEAPLIRDGVGVDLKDFLWISRPIVVFADGPTDPSFIQQIELLKERPEALRDRDVIVFTDTEPSERSALRQRFRPRGFMMVLVGKDGTVYLRKPLPWDVREITRSIDKLPLRQQEVRDRREED